MLDVKGTLSRTRMLQLFESQLEKFSLTFSNSNSNSNSNGVDEWRQPRRKKEELGGKGILEKKSSFNKARKRCHKRIFGNEIIISRVLRYKTS